jgi:two-component system LytT family response regulator
MTARVLVVDDEALARRRMRRYLAADSDVIVVGECGDGVSAVDAIRTLKPDIVLLDVQIPELDGFDVLRTLSPSELPAVVFVTAFDRYAVRAFDLHAIDYLLKPFRRDRFDLALARAKARIAARVRDQRLADLVESLGTATKHPTRVTVGRGHSLVVIDWVDVDWIEAADNYVTLHVGQTEYLLRRTLNSLEKELDGRQFARIHRSAIVQIDRVIELIPETHGDSTLRLRGGRSLTVSRTFREHIAMRIRRLGSSADGANSTDSSSRKD